MRTGFVLHHLIRSYDHVHVITFREPGAPDPRPLFPPGLSIDVIDLPPHSNSVPARALRNLARAARGIPPLIDRFSGFEAQLGPLLRPTYDLALIEHFWAASYASTLRPHTRRLALDLHNVESTLLARSAAAERSPASVLFRHWARRCRALEAEALPRFDLILATSRADAAQLATPTPVLIVPNTIPLVPRPAPSSRRPHEVVFSGNMEYHPNRAAVRWFVTDVWPLLSALRPYLTVRFLGKNDHAIRPLLGTDPRLRATGPVPDAVPALAESALAVVPLLSGSGTRIKIIEAWAAALPVVSTSIGAEGLPIHPGDDILIADSPADFAEAVVKVLQNPQFACRLSDNGRRLYEDELNWEVAWNVLSQAGL
jgi:polysaccharide biosynthesis protein PslH